jgi:hypothetical protein
VIRPEVLVVGAGPHGLTAAAYLLQAEPALAGRIAVADPQPWLARWDRRFTQLELPVLRSACVHHPDPAPYALVEYARARGREEELLGPAGSPTTGLFADLCRTLVARHDLEAARLPVRVTGLRPRADGRVDVELGGASLRVGHVLLTGSSARPHVPLLGARHSDRVRLDDVRPGERVVVVGGGLTGAQLALRASARGADVLLVVRSPLRSRAMDVEAVWLGHALPAFAGQSPAQRADAVRHARRGTVPPAVLAELQADPRVRVHVGTVREVQPGTVLLDDGRLLAVQHAWLATGHAFDARADPLTAALLSEVPVPLVDGLPVLDDDLSWGGTAVHVSGGLTALAVGPAARNLVGARMAAERSLACVAGREPVRRQFPRPATA